MYRIFPKRTIFFVFAWIVIGILLFFDFVSNFQGSSFRLSAVPAAGWVFLNVLLYNPAWRFFWRKIPVLQKLVFPDLNGKWKVELYSNWPRQVQLLDAAKLKSKSLDMRNCPESKLAELTPMVLEAEISQSWWNFEMKLYNPANNTPIKKSNSISIDPFPRSGLREPGICYIYKQENATDNVVDDNELYGAARLEYNSDKDQLEGLVWNARMWQRAMNTASKVVFSRLKDD